MALMILRRVLIYMSERRSTLNGGLINVQQFRQVFLRQVKRSAQLVQSHFLNHWSACACERSRAGADIFACSALKFLAIG